MMSGREADRLRCTGAQVVTAHGQAVALPLPAAPVAAQEAQPEGFLVDVAEDMVSEQHAWLANLVNFFAQFQGLDAACQARLGCPTMRLLEGPHCLCEQLQNFRTMPAPHVTIRAGDSPAMA